MFKTDMTGKKAGYVARFTVLAWMLVMLLVLVSCGGKNNGLKTAWEELPYVKGYEYHMLTSYDEQADALFIQIDNLVDIDNFFDVLDRSVRKADIGTLILKLDTCPSLPDDYMEQFSKRLGKLSCNSIRCLSIEGFPLDQDENWTKVLDRVGALYQPDVSLFEDYSEEGLSNLAQLKKLWLSPLDTAYRPDTLSMFSNLEEVTLTAGLMTYDQEETLEQLLVRNTEYEILCLTKLTDMQNMQRILFFPEVEGWTPSDSYYVELLRIQRYLPDVFTNVAGKVWSGDVNELIAVRSIDVLTNANGSKTVAKTFESILYSKASQLYEAAKSYAASDAAPELNGTCLVYMASPKTVNSNGQPVDDFFNNDYKILRCDNYETPTSPYDDIDTFVYIYPEYTAVGRYSDGAKAMRTTVMMQVSDVNQQICYDPVEIYSEDPPETIYTDGSGLGTHYPQMNENRVTEYLEAM